MLTEKFLVFIKSSFSEDKKNELFTYIWEKYRKKIFFYISNLIPAYHPQFEDLFQEIMLKIYNNLHTFNPSRSFKAWIYTIATNLARSEFRKKKVKSLFSLADIKEINLSYNPSFEDEIFIKQMLATLPEKYRVPIVMKEITSFSFEEISNILNKPVGTIKTLVFRGKSQLKKNMENSSNVLPREMNIIEKGVKNETY